MKNAILAILGVGAVLWISSKLPTPSAWETSGYVGIGLVLLTVVAICSKQGLATIVLGLVLMAVSFVSGVNYAPIELRGLVLTIGLISGVTFLVVGVMLVMGMHLEEDIEKPATSPLPGHLDAKLLMS